VVSPSASPPSCGQGSSRVAWPAFDSLRVLAIDRVLVPSRAVLPSPRTVDPPRAHRRPSRHIEGNIDHEKCIPGGRVPGGVVCRRTGVTDRVRCRAVSTVRQHVDGMTPMAARTGAGWPDCGLGQHSASSPPRLRRIDRRDPGQSAVRRGPHPGDPAPGRGVARCGQGCSRGDDRPADFRRARVRQLPADPAHGRAGPCRGGPSAARHVIAAIDRRWRGSGVCLAVSAVLSGGPHALDGLLVLGIVGSLYASARRRRS
jgi:hypothetical protein